MEINYVSYSFPTFDVILNGSKAKEVSTDYKKNLYYAQGKIPHYR